MNNFVDNDSDLEEEQLNLTISGPSKSSQKPRRKMFLWGFDDMMLENSLLNVNQKYDALTRHNKVKRVENNNNKSNTASANANIKQLLSDRLKMYNVAEETARKTCEMRKVRHLHKKVQILNALIEHHNSGNIIDPDNIPPEIKTQNNLSKSANTQLGVTFKESAEITVIPRNTDTDSGSSSETDSEASLEKILSILKLRRDQYKISVAQNKSAGNVPRAHEHLNIVKMFETVIKHLEMGERVDLNELPGPPECLICHINSEEKNRQAEEQMAKEEDSEVSIEEQVISHSTILQALQGRLKAYEISKMNFKREKNVGQELRIERIVKIYKDAIRLHRAGRTFPIDDLPSPPGFPPISNLKASRKWTL